MYSNSIKTCYTAIIAINVWTIIHNVILKIHYALNNTLYSLSEIWNVHFRIIHQTIFLEFEIIIFVFVCSTISKHFLNFMYIYFTKFKNTD